MLRPTDGILARFTRDLTEEAKRGRLEPVRARADEIARVIDVLLRHGKNNPALVGPAGVGKTAIVEGLAQRVAGGDVPLLLRDSRILSVDHVALLAGTTYRGQYEERIQGLVEETTAAADVVLFVDELHNLIGQGTALGVAMDAANMLKPALVRGDFRVIGATTEDEYTQWICGDPALERRFQRVTVRELGTEETLEILRARRERLERHHHVVIADDALLAALRLTDLHVSDRMRPDRALDALDEACAHTHALARYSTRAEQLIAEWRQARGLRRFAAAPPSAKRESAPGGESPHDEAEIDPLERLALDGFAALERFGADVEAALGVGAAAPSTARRSAPSPERATDARATSPERTAWSAAREAELARLLNEEGIVVRGEDIARVVAVATGKRVTWPA